MHGTILKYIEKMQYSMINVLRSAHVITFPGALGMRPGASRHPEVSETQNNIVGCVGVVWGFEDAVCMG